MVNKEANAEAQRRWREKRNQLAKHAEELEAEIAELRRLHLRDLKRMEALIKLYRVDAKTMRAIFDAADKALEDELRNDQS